MEGCDAGVGFVVGESGPEGDQFVGGRVGWSGHGCNRVVFGGGARAEGVGEVDGGTVVFVEEGGEA